MINSNKIIAKQNEEQLLKIQYAARKYYNSAESLNYCVWLLCLISLFFICLPNYCHPFLKDGIPIVFDIVAFFLTLIMNHKVHIASELRMYFDATVLDICIEKFTESKRRYIKEIAQKVYLKNIDEAEVQMTNSAKDSSPGVYDWYEFSKYYEYMNAQFECQCQNIWWNSKMTKARIITIICSAVIVAFVFLLLIANNGIINLIICSAGIILKSIERLIVNSQYYIISVQIDGAKQVLESHLSEEGIEKLQEFIDKRRAMAVFELNLFHKKSAKRLSDTYENSIS